MPPTLSDEEVDNIIETFADLQDIEMVDEELDHAKQTIEKYVRLAWEDDDPRLDHVDPDEIPVEEEDGEWTTDGPTPSPFDTQEEVNDYTGMSPGDFILYFFNEDFEVGMKNRWVQIQAARAERRGALPTKESMKTDILGMSSGIGQSNFQEAEYIAAEYWAEAQEYRRQTGGTFSDQSIASPPQQQAGPYGGGQGDGWVGGGVGGQMGGVGSPMNGGGGQTQMMQMLMEEIRSIREDMRSGGGRGGRRDRINTRADQLEGLVQEKQLMEELFGEDEHVRRLEDRIDQLRSEIASQGASSPAPPRPDTDSMEERVLMRALESPDVSLEEVMKLMEERQGVSNDPEVLKVEHETELREMELQHERERVEKVAGAFETFAERIGDGFASRLMESPTEADTNQEGEATAQPATDGGAATEKSTPATEPAEAATADATAQAEAAVPEESQECENCGAELKVTPNSMACPECEWGITPCDLCGHPVEMPPVGEADFGRCSGCETILEVPEREGETVECPDCETENTADDLRGELLQCEGCEEFRPIQRSAAVEEQVKAVAERLSGD